MPLRVGLVAATLVLVACGLLASGIAVTTILRHDLTNRVDETLLDASRSWASAPRRMPSPPTERPNGPPGAVELLRARHRHRRRIWMAVNDRGRTSAARRQRRGTGAGHCRLHHSDVQWRAMTVRTD